MSNCYQKLCEIPLKDILSDVINYLKLTKDEDWCIDIVRTKDQKQNCFLGHLFNFGGNLICDIFESGICNGYMYYDINDGKNPNYTEKTAKLRIIKYLENLREGKEKTIFDHMSDDKSS